MGKLEKTDRTGKTVEAWWALLFAEGSLGQSVIRWVWPVIGGGVGLWVASATNWISSYGVAGWAATIALGALTFIWGAVGIDHFRSRRARDIEASIAPELEYQPDTLDRVSPMTENQIAALIERRLDTWLSETLLAQFETHAQAHDRDEKLDKVNQAIKDLRDKVSSLSALHQASDTARIERESKWGSFMDAHIATTRERFKNVDGGFRAIRDREELIRLAAMIEDAASWLLQASEGKKPEWSKFELRRRQWESQLGGYCQIAEHYLPDAPDLIWHVPVEQLSGDWPEDRSLFPNDDAMLAHRTTTVIMRNFRVQHNRILDCVSAAAFQKPSMRGIP